MTPLKDLIGENIQLGSVSGFLIYIKMNRYAVLFDGKKNVEVDLTTVDTYRIITEEMVEETKAEEPLDVIEEEEEPVYVIEEVEPVEEVEELVTSTETNRLKALEPSHKGWFTYCLPVFAADWVEKAYRENLDVTNQSDKFYERLHAWLFFNYRQWKKFDVTMEEYLSLAMEHGYKLLNKKEYIVRVGNMYLKEGYNRKYVHMIYRDSEDFEFKVRRFKNKEDADAVSAKAGGETLLFYF